MYSFKILTFVFSFLLSLLTFSLTVRADYTFSDDFNSILNPNWVTILSHPSPTIVLGELEFNSTAISTTFPYIGHQYVEPIRSLSLDFRYQMKGGDFGSGIVLTENIPTAQISPPNDSGDYILAVYVLPDGKFYIFSPLCSTTPGCGLPVHSLAIAELSPNINQKLQFTFNNQNLNVFINDLLVESLNMSNYRADGMFIGNSMITSTPKIWQHYWIDNLIVDYGIYLDSTPIPSATPNPSPIASVAPSASPAPSSSPSPSPSTPPYLSQLDPNWAKQIYDHATKWAPLTERGIDRWGCAITSTSMVLQKFGVKSITGQPVTPAILNSWLRNQNDGYVGDGLLNWLAVSRFVRQSRQVGQSPTNLEFRKSTYKSSQVDSDLASGLFPILGVPGHFVASHGDLSTSFAINDPASTTKTSISKSATISTSNVYTPSNTDLSYLFFAYPPSMTVYVKDQQGNIVIGELFEEYLTNEQTGEPGSTLKTQYVAKPPSGKYTVEVSNVGDKGMIEMFMYDQNGSVKAKQRKIKATTQTAFNLKYDKAKISSCSYDDKWLWVRTYLKGWSKWVNWFDWQPWD